VGHRQTETGGIRNKEIIGPKVEESLTAQVFLDFWKSSQGLGKMLPADPVTASVSIIMTAAVMAPAMIVTAMVVTAVMTSAMVATAMVTATMITPTMVTAATVVAATMMTATAVVAAAAVAALRHRIRWERQRCCHCGDVSYFP